MFPTIAAVVVLTTLTIGCFWKLVSHPRGLLVGPQRNGSNDLSTYFTAARNFPRLCRDRFGQWPAWNPYASSGVPFLGNPQSAMWYPPNWICWWLDARQCLSWMLVGHHLFAGLGVYALCRRSGCARASSTVGGSIFLAAPYLIAHTGEGHYAQICSVAWYPWAFLAYEHLRDRHIGAVFALPFVLAMSFLAGHVQETYYLFIALSVLVVVDAIVCWRWESPPNNLPSTLRGGLPHQELNPPLEEALPQSEMTFSPLGGALPPKELAPSRLGGEGRGAGSLRRHASGRGRCAWLLLSWIAIVTLFAGLVAVDLLPIWLHSRETIRGGGLNSASGGAISTGLVNLFQLLNPFALGGPQSYGGPDKFFWESLLTFGLVPLVLAVAGMTKSSNRALVRRSTWLAIAGIAFAFGGGSPVFEFVFRVIPGIDLFRAPSRVLFLCSLWVAILAAAGVDALVAPRTGTPGRVGTWLRRGTVVALAAILLLLTIGDFTETNEPDSIDDQPVRARAESVIDPTSPSEATARQSNLERQAIRRSVGSRGMWAILLIASILIFSAERWPAFAALAHLPILLLIAIELRGYSQRMLAVAYPSAGHSESPLAAMLETGPESYRVLAPQELISDQTALELALARPHGYEPLALARYADFYGVLTGKENPYSDLIGASTLDASKYRKNLLDLLNVRYAVLSSAMKPPDGWRSIGAALIARPIVLDGDTATPIRVVVYENPDVMPRAFIVGKSRVVADSSQQARALAELKPSQEAVVTVEFLPPGPRAEFAPARITTYSANQVVVEAELTAPGYLMLTDTWSPGWTARDNGQPTSVIPANLAFRAVPLSGGKHRVVFEFVPPGLIVGAIVSGAAWGLLLVSWVYWAIRRRRSRTTPRYEPGLGV